MFDAIVEGVLIAIDRMVCSMRPATDRLIDWVRDSTEPPANLEFHASDGAQYTGLVVLERSKAVLMLAFRSGPASAPTPAFKPAYSPPITSASSSSYQPRLRDFDDDPGDGWPPDPYGRR